MHTFQCFLSINTDTSSVLSFILRRFTIPYLSFYQKELLVIRISVCASSFRDKLCAGITDEELIAIEDVGCVTDKALVRKIWDNCVEYEYVSESYNFMRSLVDKIILK